MVRINCRDPDENILRVFTFYVTSFYVLTDCFKVQFYKALFKTILEYAITVCIIELLNLVILFQFMFRH